MTPTEQLFAACPFNLAWSEYTGGRIDRVCRIRASTTGGFWTEHYYKVDYETNNDPSCRYRKVKWIVGDPLPDFIAEVAIAGMVEQRLRDATQIQIEYNHSTPGWQWRETPLLPFTKSREVFKTKTAILLAALEHAETKKKP